MSLDSLREHVLHPTPPVIELEQLEHVPLTVT